MSRRGRRRHSRRRKSSSSSKQSVSPYIFKKPDNKKMSIGSKDEVVEKGETDCLRKEHVVLSSEDEGQEDKLKHNVLPHKTIYTKTSEDAETSVRVVTSVSVSNSAHRVQVQQPHQSFSEKPSNIVEINCFGPNVTLEIHESFEKNSCGLRSTLVLRSGNDDHHPWVYQNQNQMESASNNEPENRPKSRMEVKVESQQSFTNNPLWNISPPEDFAEPDEDPLEQITRELHTCRIGTENPALEQQNLEESILKSSELAENCVEYRPSFSPNRSSFTHDFIHRQKRKSWIRNNSIAAIEHRSTLFPRRRRQTFPISSRGGGVLEEERHSFSSFLQALPLLCWDEKSGTGIFTSMLTIDSPTTLEDPPTQSSNQQRKGEQDEEWADAYGRHLENSRVVVTGGGEGGEGPALGPTCSSSAEKTSENNSLGWNLVSAALGQSEAAKLTEVEPETQAVNPSTPWDSQRQEGCPALQSSLQDVTESGVPLLPLITVETHNSRAPAGEPKQTPTLKSEAEESPPVFRSSQKIKDSDAPPSSSSDRWAKRRKLFRESQQWSSIGVSPPTSDITEESVSEEVCPITISAADQEVSGFYCETFHSSAWMFRGDHVTSEDVCSSLTSRGHPVSIRERTVRINKGGGEYPWGLRIQFSQPIVVTEVDTNGAAEEAGLVVGDYVQAVNGVDVTAIPHSEAAALARQGPDVLTLTIGSDISSGPNTPRPACRGYLHKRTQSGLVRGWRRRWFVLRHNGCLYYYHHKREEGRRQAVCAVRLEGAEVGTDDSLGKPFVFRCRPHAGTRVFFFCAASNQDRKRWLEAMGKAVHPVVQNHVWVDVTRHNASLPPLAVQNPDCLGLLHMMDRRRDLWEQHYCLLKDGCLYLYSGIRATHAHGGIYLQGYVVSEQPYGSRKSTMELRPPSDEFRTFHLCADNPGENQRWILVLQASIKKWLPLHQALQDYMNRPLEETRM